MRMQTTLPISAILAVGMLSSHGALAVDATCGEPKTNACMSDGSTAPPVPVNIAFGRFGPPSAGSTEMRINPPTKKIDRGKSQRRLEITLKRLGSDSSFENKVVTISSTGNPWLSGTGKVSDGPNRQITICIPDACTGGSGTDYKYDVDIADLGQLDPRVKVED